MDQAANCEGRKGTVETVQVALRIRPLMPPELDRGCGQSIEVVAGEPQVKIKDLDFTFNHVFAQHITQKEFYDTAVKGLIGKLFQGYNVTILAYGQTGSGKTYTMGTNYSGLDGDSTKLGVIPQAVADIFNYIDAHEDKFTFKVNVSFMELYQEQCYDLLSGKERGHSIIEIREDNNKGVKLPGITEKPVTSTMETMMVLEQGSLGRVTGSTAMNQASSRSHAVFTIIIAKESRSVKNIATTSKFHLVDLAGSERNKKTQASGERFKESVKINHGLLVLGNVISALGDGANRNFIGYRDSKLTRLLQDSLGGNSLTLMVACVSPADYNLDETLSTLRYAGRARRIWNKPIINQDAKAAENIRSFIIEQLEDLRNRTDESKAQISDLQRNIDDKENKSPAQWDNIQSLPEAKVALKILFDILVDAQNQSEKGYQARYEEVKESYERLQLEFENSKSEFERQLATIKIQNEQKLAALVALQRGDCDSCCDLQNVNSNQQEQIELLGKENRKLAEELDQLRATDNEYQKRHDKNGNTQAYFQCSVGNTSSRNSEREEEYDDLSDDDDGETSEDFLKDPDWRNTPLFKRLQAIKVKSLSDDDDDESDDDDDDLGWRATFLKRMQTLRTRVPTNCMIPDGDGRNGGAGGAGAVKRRNDGSQHCMCRGNCATRICGCRKATRSCGDVCRCPPALCQNRKATDEKPSSEIAIEATPKRNTTFLEKGGHPVATKKKKKKGFFS